MQKQAIIVAGGSGKRMGAEIPKQFIEIQGKPVLIHTLEQFHQFDATIKLIVVLPGTQHNYWQELLKKQGCSIPHVLVNGGQERFYSVLNALQVLEPGGVVAIHDGVRPLVSFDTLHRCFHAAEKHKAIIPAIPVTESVRWSDQEKNYSLDRSNLFLVQTPQVFDVSLIVKAYQQPFQKTFTDDASVVEALGETIHMVEGNPENIKITRPMDLLMAEALLKK